MTEVIATHQGFFGKLRDVGERFEVPNDLKASWFVPAEKAESKKPRANQPAQGADKTAGDLV